MEQEFYPIMEIDMTQYNMNQVLKRFGQNGVIVTEKEVQQLVTMDALEPDNLKYFSREYHRAVMNYLMFLK